MVSAHNKTFFFFFTLAEQKKKKETLVMLFDESCTSSAMKARHEMCYFIIRRAADGRKRACEKSIRPIS